MKNLFLVAIFALCSTIAVQGQTFKLGAVVGTPIGDAADASSLVVGADAYLYLTDIDNFLQMGVTAGFRNYFIDESDDFQYVPVAVAARVKIFDILSAGADVGYGFGINNDGGFYYRPVVGIDLADTIELIASYEAMTDVRFTASNFNVGILFTF